MTTQVLIVEPSRTQAQIVEAVLEDAGYEVVTAANSSPALEMLAGRPADVVIVNYTLPDGPSSDLCRQIKAHASKPCVIVIAESGRAEQILESLAAGADGFYIKSTDFAHLAEQVGRSLDHARAQHQAVMTEAVRFEGRDYALSLTAAQWLDVLVATLSDLTELRDRCRDLSQRLAESGEPTTSHLDADATSKPLIESPLVLVAEDSKTNLLLGTALLEKAGYRVLPAADGLEVLNHLESPTGAEIAFILMDVEMPRMDGLETTRCIRTSETLSSRQLPILAMTAHAEVQDQQACLDAGMDACLAKPLSIEAITKALEHIDRR